MAALHWWQRRELLILGSALLLVVTGLYAWPERAAAVDELLYPLVSTLSTARAWVTSNVHDLVHWRDLQRENQELRERIRLLEVERLGRLELMAENRRLQQLTGMNPPPGYTPLAARVIGHSADNWRRYVLVDQGDTAGVKKNTVAVNAEGLLGRVVKVTRWSSQVLLIADSNSAVSCINERTRARGIVQGQNFQPAILSYPSSRAEFEAGDSLVTSGLGGLFPKGLAIGTVGRVRRQNEGNS